MPFKSKSPTISVAKVTFCKTQVRACSSCIIRTSLTRAFNWLQYTNKLIDIVDFFFGGGAIAWYSLHDGTHLSQIFAHTIPSSISWYLARAFMSTRRMWQPWHESNEQGEYCVSGSAASLIAWSFRLERLYKLSTFLFLLYHTKRYQKIRLDTMR